MTLTIGDTLYRQGSYKIVSAVITGETESYWLLNRIEVEKHSLIECWRDGEDKWFTNEELK